MNNAGFLFLQEEESRIYSHNCFWDTWHLMVKVRQVLMVYSYVVSTHILPIRFQAWLSIPIRMGI